MIDADTGPVREARPAAGRSTLGTLRMIAVFEAFKGVCALAAGAGLLSLLHHDLHHLAEALIGHFRLDPDAHYPAILLHYADLLSNADLRSLLLLGSGYVVLRWLEAYGLWNERAWGEWLGALSGALYVPFEIRHLMLRPSWIGFAVLAGNLLVVAYLLLQLWRRRPARPDPARRS